MIKILQSELENISNNLHNEGKEDNILWWIVLNTCTYVFSFDEANFHNVYFALKIRYRDFRSSPCSCFTKRAVESLASHLVKCYPITKLVRYVTTRHLFAKRKEKRKVYIYIYIYSGTQAAARRLDLLSSSNFSGTWLLELWFIESGRNFVDVIPWLIAPI